MSFSSFEAVVNSYDDEVVVGSIYADNGGAGKPPVSHQIALVSAKKTTPLKQMPQRGGGEKDVDFGQTSAFVSRFPHFCIQIEGRVAQASYASACKH